MRNSREDAQSETDEVLLLENLRYHTHKQRYISILEDYLLQRINLEELQNQFFALWHYDRDRELTPAEVTSMNQSIYLLRLRGFLNIVSVLFDWIDALDVHPEFPDKIFFSDEEFEKFVKEGIRRMQENYP